MVSDHLENQNVDGWIILSGDLRLQNGKILTGSVWLRRETIDGLLRAR